MKGMKNKVCIAIKCIKKRQRSVIYLACCNSAVFTTEPPPPSTHTHICSFLFPSQKCRGPIFRGAVGCFSGGWGLLQGIKVVLGGVGSALDSWLRSRNAFAFTNKLALSLSPCSPCLPLWLGVFFQGLYGQTHGGKHWLVDRFHRPTHKPSEHECGGL